MSQSRRSTITPDLSAVKNVSATKRSSVADVPKVGPSSGN